MKKKIAVLMVSLGLSFFLGLAAQAHYAYLPAPKSEVNDEITSQMYEDAEDERSDAAFKTKHPDAFMAGFDFAVQRADVLFGNNQ